MVNDNTQYIFKQNGTYRFKVKNIEADKTQIVPVKIMNIK